MTSDHAVGVYEDDSFRMSFSAEFTSWRSPSLLKGWSRGHNTFLAISCAQYALAILISLQDRTRTTAEKPTSINLVLATTEAERVLLESGYVNARRDGEFFL